MLGRGDAVAERAKLREAILADIANTEAWIDALRTSRTPFFRITADAETPFSHKTPIEDLELKLAVTRAHIGDEAGPNLPELRKTRKKSLQFSAIP